MTSLKRRRAASSGQDSSEGDPPARERSATPGHWKSFLIVGLPVVIAVSATIAAVPVLTSHSGAAASTTPLAPTPLATTYPAAGGTACGPSTMAGMGMSGSSGSCGDSAMAAASGSATSTAAGAGYVLADPQVTGVTPSTFKPAGAAHHEFQADCAVSKQLPDDPIVLPGKPGASHMHSFLGNTDVNAFTTFNSLKTGGTSCAAPGDMSGYWMPTLYNGTQVVDPVGPQIIYYKSGVDDYTSVRPFPPGLRFLAGSMFATPAQFLPNSPEGWTCSGTYDNADIPATCPVGSRLIVRYQAPSCWDGRYLDTPDHKSHMAYPVDKVCPADHPVALPMIEFKMAYPVPANGNTSQYHLSSGHGYSYHFDFFGNWDPATLAALVKHCVNGGLQCDGQGYDQHHPQLGAALDADYQLPGTHPVLSRAGWTATASVGSGAANMLDGDPRTRWTSGAPMVPGESVTIDMQAVHTIDLVTIDSGGAGGDYARGYQVLLSTDGGTWSQPVATGAGFQSMINASFARQSARYIKVVQTSGSTSWWSIAELTASG